MLKRVLFFLAIGATPALAQTAALPIQSCDTGAVQAVTSSLTSSNYMKGVIPSCTVTIYLTGTTTLATYYLSQGGSPQTGPFTASSTGQFLAFATTNQGYDIVLSGGVAPNTYPIPAVYTDVFPSSSVAGCVTSSTNFFLLANAGPCINSGVTETGSGTGTVDTFPGAVLAQTIGPVIQCDQFAGADVSIKANACNAAVIAAGGGTMDLRKLLAGTTTGSVQINIGTQAANNAGIGITALLPTTGSYSTSMVGGPVTSASKYSSTGCSGYVNGDVITPIETGFAYTGVAAGATLTVTSVSSGCPTAMTVATAGGGYLSSKYVATTGGSGTGLFLNLNAADCGMRQYGRTTIQSGSIGAGPATFQIAPSNSGSGFRMDSDYCTDTQIGIYVRQEGGIRLSNSGTYAFTSGEAHLRWLDDQSTFTLLETSSPSDDGALVESMCCGSNVFSIHADSGNTGGYPVKIGSGGVLYNACTTSGSPTVTVPYGHLTAEYLGDTMTGQPGIPNGSIITGINSFTSLTINNNATLTSSGQSACTGPTLTGGSGLRLHVLDPIQPQITAISLHNLVANAPGPGLQNMMVSGNAAAIDFYTSYMESNYPVDNYTPMIYLDTATGGINFHGLEADSHSGSTKYAIEGNTTLGWCGYGVHTQVGIEDQGIIIPAPTIGQQNNLNYCKNGFSALVPGANGVPDSNWRQGTTYWTIPSGLTLTAGVGVNGDNGLVQTLTGSASSGLRAYTTNVGANMQAGGTYTLSAYVSGSNISTGTTEVQLCSVQSSSSCSGTAYGTAVSSGAINGILSATFTLPGGYTGPAYVVLETVNLVGSGNIVISEPMLTLGGGATYTLNEFDSAFNVSTGVNTNSLTVGGGTAMTSQSSANSQIVTCPTGGTSTQYCAANGTWQSLAGSITLGTAGQLPVMNAGATAYAPVTLSQDCTLTSTGAITCLKTNNVAFTAASTTAIGTSGATIPLLSTSNTWTTTQTAPTFITGSNVETSASGIQEGSNLGLLWSSTTTQTGTKDTTLCRASAGSVEVGSGTSCAASGTLLAANATLTGAVNSAVYQTATNCSSSASPAVCGSAAAGSAALPTNAVSSSIVVNTTAVTANSQIFVMTDDTLGTKLGVTCNSTVATLVGGLTVSARTAGTSFTVANNVAVVTNPLCISWMIVN